MPQRIEEKLPAGDALMLSAAVFKRFEESGDFFRVADFAQARGCCEERRQMMGARAYPFANRHREAAFIGERIGRRQRAFEPSAQQIFAFAPGDLEAIGKAEGE